MGAVVGWWNRWRKILCLRGIPGSKAPAPKPARKIQDLPRPICKPWISVRQKARTFRSVPLPRLHLPVSRVTSTTPRLQFRRLRTRCPASMIRGVPISRLPGRASGRIQMSRHRLWSNVTNPPILRWHLPGRRQPMQPAAPYPADTIPYSIRPARLPAAPLPSPMTFRLALRPRHPRMSRSLRPTSDAILQGGWIHDLKRRESCPVNSMKTALPERS